MALPAWLTGLFAPALDAVDKLHTSQEERGQIRLALASAQIELGVKVLDYEARIVEAATKVIMAEASGESWMQRNWRPMTMLMFASIVAWNYIAVDIATWAMTIMTPGTPPPPRLETPEGLWTLMQIGLGGYVALRSGEKIAATLAGKTISFGKKDGE